MLWKRPVIPQRVWYREAIPWPAWLSGSFWVSLWLVNVALLFELVTDNTALHVLTLAGIFVVGAVFHFFVIGSNILVQETRMVVYIGRVPFVRRTIPFRDICNLKCVKYRPFRDFMGWGFRRLPGREAWTARGNGALLITTYRGRRIFIGSDEPETLELALGRAIYFSGMEPGADQEDPPADSTDSDS